MGSNSKLPPTERYTQRRPTLDDVMDSLATCGKKINAASSLYRVNANRFHELVEVLRALEAIGISDGLVLDTVRSAIKEEARSICAQPRIAPIGSIHADCIDVAARDVVRDARSQFDDAQARSKGGEQ